MSTCSLAQASCASMRVDNSCGAMHYRRCSATAHSNDWWDSVQLHEPASRNAGRLRKLYLEKLRAVGLPKIGNEISILNSRLRQVYVLLYATRSDLGRKLWNESTDSPQLSLLDLIVE